MKRRGIVWLFIIGITFLILIAQLFLPQFAANKLRNILEKETDSIDYLDVDITSFPALEILTGRIDHVVIASEGMKIDNLYLDTFNVSYRDIILKKGGFTGVNTDLEVVISEGSINDYVNSKYHDLKDFVIQITPDQVLLQGLISIFEADFQLKLSGNFVINDQQNIYFVPEDFQIEDIKVPVGLLKSYIEKLDFSFNLKELGVPMDISDINLISGFIIINGGVQERGRDNQ
ncbi:MAG: DUF2993 domain-containing protein [Halanaerobiales bacterium]